jgi:hypothetical protein
VSAAAARVLHPVLNGYHAMLRGQVWEVWPVVGKGLLPPGHRVAGLRPVDGMPHQS